MRTNWVHHMRIHTHDPVSHVVHYNQQHFPFTDDNAADILINNQFIGLAKLLFLSFSPLGHFFCCEWELNEGWWSAQSIFNFDISTFHGAQKLLPKIDFNSLFCSSGTFFPREVVERGGMTLMRFQLAMSDELMNANDFGCGWNDWCNGWELRSFFWIFYEFYWWAWDIWNMNCWEGCRCGLKYF